VLNPFVPVGNVVGAGTGEYGAAAINGPVAVGVGDGVGVAYDGGRYTRFEHGVMRHRL
jgi:hypothetical protein